MRATRTTTLGSLAAIAVLTLAACGGSDGGGSAASEEEICDGLQAIQDVFEAGDAASSQEEAEQAFADLADAVEDFAEIAPDEIKDDAEKLAEGTRVFADADFENMTEEQEAILDDESFEEAGDRVDEYALDTCGIELNS